MLAQGWYIGLFPPSSLSPSPGGPQGACSPDFSSCTTFWSTSGIKRSIRIHILARFQHLTDPALFCSTVCYSLGIYLLNLFLAFLQPKFDPSLTQDEGLEDGQSSLPTKQDEEFRPFIRRLPEFKFWHSATRAIAISFFCTWFSVFNVPVFWPVLVVYFIILFSLTSKLSFNHTPVGSARKRGETRKMKTGSFPSSRKIKLTFLLTPDVSAETNSTHDQIPLRAIHLWENTIQFTKQYLETPHNFLSPVILWFIHIYI